MSFIAKHKCDSCGKTSESIFNGEHWLPPVGWSEILDAHTGNNLKLSLCPECIAKLSKPQSKQDTPDLGDI